MSAPTEKRPPRSDSIRNRERLLVAAREVFAERGHEATLNDIARHAGLGIGTAYRHFPNKQAIAAEFLTDATEKIAKDARAALLIEDPWEALVSFIEVTAERQAADRSLYESLAGLGDYDEQKRIWPQIIASVTELFHRAKALGVVRADAEPQDIAAIFNLLGPAFEMSRTSEGIWRRYLALILDGLRATDRPVLPAPPQPLAEVDVVRRASKGTR
jgi:AcrR family transcriptional regulator